MTTLQRLAWRLLAGIGVLWGAATLTFLAITSVPATRPWQFSAAPTPCPAPS